MISPLFQPLIFVLGEAKKKTAEIEEEVKKHIGEQNQAEFKST